MPSIDPKPPEPTGTLNGTGQNNHPHSPGGTPPERDDVGIVPYIPSDCVPFNRAVNIPHP